MSWLAAGGSVPILMYHAVTPRSVAEFRRYTVTTKAFAAQMRWLTVAGYRVIGLDRLLEHRAAGTAVPRRSVVITFDDGFQDCVDHAVPVLQARGFTAVFYLVAGLVGQRSDWLIPEVGVAFPLMGWEAARALAAAGFRCGSHGLGHRRLATLSREGCREELEGSRRVLEDRLGHAVRHLAYPFGSVDWTVRALAQEAGYRSACSTRKGLSGREDDPLALHRVPVYGEDSLLDFAVRIETGQTARELWKRRTGSVRGWRSRGNGRGTG